MIIKVWNGALQSVVKAIFQTKTRSHWPPRTIHMANFLSLIFHFDFVIFLQHTISLSQLKAFFCAFFSFSKLHPFSGWYRLVKCLSHRYVRWWKVRGRIGFTWENLHICSIELLFLRFCVNVPHKYPFGLFSNAKYYGIVFARKMVAK